MREPQILCSEDDLGYTQESQTVRKTAYAEHWQIFVIKQIGIIKIVREDCIHTIHPPKNEGP
jgi:hypothetical protein